MYNRGPAFDMLLEKLQARQDALGGGLKRQRTAATTSVHFEPAENDLPKPPPTTEPDAVDWFRESLPVEIQITRGAVVLGNKSTPSLLIAGFRSALGTCGAVEVRIWSDHAQRFPFLMNVLVSIAPRFLQTDLHVQFREAQDCVSKESRLRWVHGRAWSNDD